MIVPVHHLPGNCLLYASVQALPAALLRQMTHCVQQVLIHGNEITCHATRMHTEHLQALFAAHSCRMTSGLQEFCVYSNKTRSHLNRMHTEQLPGLCAVHSRHISYGVL